MRKKNPVLEEEIIRVSARMVAEKGITAFSLRSLAAKLGISLGNLYTYYSSKDLILITVLEKKSDSLIRMVADIQAATVEEYVSKLSDLCGSQYSMETGPIMAEIGSSDDEAIRKMNEVLAAIDREIAAALTGFGITEDAMFRASFIRRNLISVLREGLDPEKSLKLILNAIK